jgi:transcriptional regulator with XRE-family HTH domain
MSVKPTKNSSKGTDETSESMRALFGANFRRGRQKAKLTQVAVEELTGIRQHYISEVAHGLHNLTLGTMMALAQAVGSDVRALLKRPSKRR